ncbi:DUF72 domain-containing protein [Puia sp.]|uniref:DUF72 domain-containing protein n=1 Tax=Puia sp. TaxID=2045100 RepID=UPI002F402FCD
MMTDRSKFYVGISGLVLPVANKQQFPPEFRAGTRLTYYASIFNSIEINSSFYKIPQPATFARWAGEVPEGFRFTVKLWRGITHAQGLHFIPIDVNKFLHAAGELGLKKGCLLVQLPPGVHADKTAQLERMLERIVSADTDGSWRIAVEFRHRSWYRPETYDLLGRYRAGMVLQDMPASKRENPAGEDAFIYVRYHGVAGDYRGGYPEEVLLRDAEKMSHWLAAGKDVYVYFNNTIGDALANALTLRGMVSANHPANGGGR